MENTDAWQEVTYLSWQEPPPQNPTRCIEGSVLVNISSVQAPQPKLVKRNEYGIQVQPRIDYDRLVAALADPSYLTWQSHHFDQFSSDTPES